MDFNAFQTQPQLRGSRQSSGSLHAAHYQLGVRALGDDDFAVHGDTARHRGDDALANLGVFRADGLIHRYRDFRSCWQRRGFGNRRQHQDQHCECC